MVVPDRDEIILRLNDWEKSLRKYFVYNFETSLLNFKMLRSKIPNLIEIVNNKYQTLDIIEQNLNNGLHSKLKNAKILLYKILDTFSPDSFKSQVNIYSTNLNNSFEKIDIHMKKLFYDWKEKINFKKRELSILSYKNTLKRGFTVVRKEKKIILSDSEIKKNETFEIEFFKSKTLAKKI